MSERIRQQVSEFNDGPTVELPRTRAELARFTLDPMESDHDRRLASERLAEMQLDKPPKRPTMPSREQIAEEQRCFLDAIAFDLDPLRFCWACRADCLLPSGIYMQKAHIIAHYLGGHSRPSNFFLLCKGCHDEQPDYNDAVNACFWLVCQERHEERIKRRSWERARAAISYGLGAERTTELLRVRS